MDAIVSVFGANSVVVSFEQDERPELCDLKLRLSELLDIPYDEQRIEASGGFPLSAIGDDDHIPLFNEGDASIKSFCLYLRLNGGKGGFGSMLRAQGGRMSSQKTTNTDACRDLSGRRIRTVNDAKKVAEYVQKEAEREKDKKEKLKRKIDEKLEYADRPSKKHRFEDSKFFDESEEQVEGIKNAVAEALKETMKNNANHKGKGKAEAVEPAPAKPKTNQPLGMWDDMSDYESEEGDEEEEEDDAEEDDTDNASEEEEEDDKTHKKGKPAKAESSSSAAKLHPAQAMDSKVISPQQSLVVAKKLLMASFGCVSYLRGLFPEENFHDDRACNVQIKTVKRGYSFEGDAFLNWLECGIFDALNKQYLRTIVLGIYLDKEKPTDLTESYTFNITYADGEPTIGIGSPLPNERYLTIRLYYWDDVTPPDYEPECFVFCNDEPNMRLRFSSSTEEVKVGEVDARYHAIDVRMKYVNPDATENSNAYREMSANNGHATMGNSVAPSKELWSSRNTKSHAQPPPPTETVDIALDTHLCTLKLESSTISTFEMEQIDKLPDYEQPRMDAHSNTLVPSDTSTTRTRSLESRASTSCQAQLQNQPAAKSRPFNIIYDLETMIPVSITLTDGPNAQCTCVCNMWQEGGDMVSDP
ncbi:DNA binding protein [Actinomortierella ambigua]|nr:DNA binding protein [Actinomortierella ambigua]